MATLNTQVRIISSDDLTAMCLSDLAGRSGRVVEQIFSFGGKRIGYMVCLDEPFDGECLWFVPQNSVADEKNC
ncbi:MAG: hypothetical protein LBU98_06475 [Alistipes sp.]|jgi:hypothetical protein|nr:hypothetical protein [Alistipes sp.]